MAREPLEMLRALAAGQDSLVSSPQALAAGLAASDITRLRRAGRWRSMAHGVYLLDPDRYADGVPEYVWWRVALLAHGPQFCLVASSAVRAFGVVGLIGSNLPVELGWIGAGSRHMRQPGDRSRVRCFDGPAIIVRQLVIAPDEITTLRGLPVRSIGPSVIDTALNSDRPTALSLLDSVLHLNLLSHDELAAQIGAVVNRRGILMLRELVPYADGRAESQPESRIRLACIDGLVPPDDLQYQVRSADGRLIAVGDLAWHARRRRPLLGEVDGVSVHDTPTAVFRDRFRGNALAGQACDTIRFTYADSFRPAYVAAVVHAALVAG